MNLLLECIEKRYAVEIPIELFNILDGSLYALDADGYKRNKKDLYDDLEKFPELSGIDWNGHFGNFVYFSITVEYDKPRLHNKIKKCIQKHLDRCTRYKEKHKL
jgi:hypothetical protein